MYQQAPGRVKEGMRRSRGCHQNFPVTDAVIKPCAVPHISRISGVDGNLAIEQTSPL